MAIILKGDKNIALIDVGDILSISISSEVTPEFFTDRRGVSERSEVLAVGGLSGGLSSG
jgi:hypothetical protein